MVADRYRIDKQSVFQIAKSKSFTRFIEQLMERAHENLFLKSAAILLGVTAAAKLISATGSAKILDYPDPIFLITNRVVMTGAGSLELLAVALLWFHKNIQCNLLTVAWLGSNFLIYRFGLWFLQVKQPCSCLGTVGELLPLKPETLSFTLKSIVIYLFATSIFLLLRRKSERVPYCGQLSSVRS